MGLRIGFEHARQPSSWRRRHEADPVTAASQGKRADSYPKFLDKDGVRGMRLGVVRQLFTPQNTDPDVMKRMEQALDDLRRLGATIVDPVTIAEIDSIPPPSRPPGIAVRPPVPRRCRRVRESRPAHPRGADPARLGSDRQRQETSRRVHCRRVVGHADLLRAQDQLAARVGEHGPDEHARRRALGRASAGPDQT